MRAFVFLSLLSVSGCAVDLIPAAVTDVGQEVETRMQTDSDTITRPDADLAAVSAQVAAFHALLVTNDEILGQLGDTEEVITGAVGDTEDAITSAVDGRADGLEAALAAQDWTLVFECDANTADCSVAPQALIDAALAGRPIRVAQRSENSYGQLWKMQDCIKVSHTLNSTWISCMSAVSPGADRIEGQGNASFNRAVMDIASEGMRWGVYSSTGWYAWEYVGGDSDSDKGGDQRPLRWFVQGPVQ